MHSSIRLSLILLALYLQTPTDRPSLTVLAGNGHIGFSGDGGAATEATFNRPMGVAVDRDGNVYVADSLNHRIRKIDTRGVITTVAGNGLTGEGMGRFWGDGGPATKAALNTPMGVAVDDRGNVFIADTMNHRIRKIDGRGVITTVAGNGQRGNAGDVAGATLAQLDTPTDVVVDSLGNFLIADSQNHRIRRVNVRGNVTGIAGIARRGYEGDGGPANVARFYLPLGVGLDSLDNIYIADTRNNRVRKMDIQAIIRVRSNKTLKTGIINTIAGNGIAGNSGDGGSALQASLNAPHDVAVDSKGNVYITDTDNRCIRKVDPNGIITTAVGMGTLVEPTHLAVDRDSNLYISDRLGGRIYKLRQP